jgi:hypothetical protein
MSTTMSSNTSSVISCLDQGQHQARPTLTLGASQDKDQQQQQHLSTMLQVQSSAGHHHQEQHFITSLQGHHQSNNNNILSCSSVCPSGLPSANNGGALSDQTNNSNNMHLFEVDFM